MCLEFVQINSRLAEMRINYCYYCWLSTHAFSCYKAYCIPDFPLFFTYVPVVLTCYLVQTPTFQLGSQIDQAVGVLASICMKWKRYAQLINRAIAGLSCRGSPGWFRGCTVMWKAGQSLKSQLLSEVGRSVESWWFVLELQSVAGNGCPGESVTTWQD